MAQAGTNQHIHDEVLQLAQHIRDSKKDILRQDNDVSPTDIIDASKQLDAVIACTEAATNAIMDAADAIGAEIAGAGNKDIIGNAVSRIYEACSFQDITGQRIAKVIKLLATIEERVIRINSLFGDSSGTTGESKSHLPNDKNLLNGPQLPGNAASQQNVDSLFASMDGKK